jgi:hypothetical protein
LVHLNYKSRSEKISKNNYFKMRSCSQASNTVHLNGIKSHRRNSEDFCIGERYDLMDKCDEGKKKNAVGKELTQHSIG